MPAAPLHAQSGVSVFCDRFNGDAANVVQRLSTEHCARTTEEAGIPKVVSILDQAVKQLSFIGNFPKLSEIALEWIGRIKMVRSLHHTETAISLKPPERGLKKRAGWNVIRVENRNQFAAGAS